MERPKFRFSPPMPFPSDAMKAVLERLDAIERELAVIRRRISELEGKPRFVKPFTEKEGVRPAAEKPVLLPSVDVGNIRVIEVLLDWVHFLLSKVGREGFDDVVQYYVDIGWISEEVGELLKKYASGMHVEGGDGIMLPEDHAKSLDYITRIREAMG